MGPIIMFYFHDHLSGSFIEKNSYDATENY